MCTSHLILWDGRFLGCRLQDCRRVQATFASGGLAHPQLLPCATYHATSTDMRSFSISFKNQTLATIALPNTRTNLNAHTYQKSRPFNHCTYSAWLFWMLAEAVSVCMWTGKPKKYVVIRCITQRQRVAPLCLLQSANSRLYALRRNEQPYGLVCEKIHG